MTARTTLVVTNVDIDGINTAGVAPDVTNGNDFPNNGKQMLFVDNASVDTDVVITLQTYPRGNSPLALTVADKAITVPFGTSRMIGPFPPSLYGDAKNRVQFNADVSADVLVKALALTADPG